MKIASWNVEGRLSRFAEKGRRGSPEQIIETIKRLDSDIIFLPEAFDGTKRIEPEVQYQLDQLGYTPIVIAYDEHSDRQYQAVVDPHMMLLSRLEVVRRQEFRLGDIRTMVMADVVDPDTGQTVRIFGIHLDDRNEENRLRQVENLLPLINSSSSPVIAIGDFNAMHSASVPARILRNGAVLGAIDILPHPRSKDILRRLSEMASGNTMREIEDSTTLVDADPKKRPTTTPKMRDQEWMPSIRMAQIDHILVSPEIAVSDFGVARDGGSDHRAISATLNVTRQNNPPVL